MIQIYKLKKQQIQDFQLIKYFYQNKKENYIQNKEQQIFLNRIYILKKLLIVINLKKLIQFNLCILLNFYIGLFKKKNILINLLIQLINQQLKDNVINNHYYKKQQQDLYKNLLLILVLQIIQEYKVILQIQVLQMH